MQTHTVFGSLTDYTKGSIELVTGEARHYVFSNIFEVAARSKPYERVVVAKNMEYVQEVMRAEGVSPWFACGHDEFALCMDGEITVDFVEMKSPPDAGKDGAVLAGENPDGRRMGYVKLKRGHQVLLESGNAYRFSASRTGVLMQQTLLGDLSVQKWREICFT